MNIAMSWVSLEKFSVELIHWNILCESGKVFSTINPLEKNFVSLENLSVELIDWNIFIPMLPDGSG